MNITYETAERVAGYYCAVRALEDELGEDCQSHPEWEEKEEALTEEWALTDEEDEVLGAALDAGLCDYFRAEDVIQVLSV